MRRGRVGRRRRSPVGCMHPTGTPGEVLEIVPAGAQPEEGTAGDGGLVSANARTPRVSR
jgi:hypothetical protein